MAGPYLVFELTSPGERRNGADSFALELGHVLQVVETPELTRVPLAPPVIEGIVNHHGRIVTVFDPAPLLGLEAQPQAAAQVVIIRRPDGSGNVGLKTARIREIVTANLLEAVDVPAGPCVGWVARKDTRLIHVIAPVPFIEELVKRFGGNDTDGDRVRRQGANA
jgi:chemotaxis signal transduction protein